MILERVNQIGYGYYNRFKMKNGSIQEVEITAEEYANLKQPTLEGGTWINSYEAPKFDSKDGKLGDGQCAALITHYVKLPGCSLTTVRNEDMAGDDLSDKIAEEIKIAQKEII